MIILHLPKITQAYSGYTLVFTVNHSGVNVCGDILMIQPDFYGIQPAHPAMFEVQQL